MGLTGLKGGVEGMMLVSNPDQLQNKKLREWVRQVDSLTDSSDGYECYAEHGEQLKVLLNNIMIFAIKEDAWYLYFHALRYMFYILSRYDMDKKVALKCAKNYFMFRACRMNREIPNYVDTNISELNGYILNEIFRIYKEDCSINDAWMDSYMRFFKYCVDMYKEKWCYYHAMIRLGLLYQDKEMAKKGKQKFDKLDCSYCYICSHEVYLGYYLLFDDLESAEALLHNLVEKRIPVNYLWSYKKCARANKKSLYEKLLGYCLLLGKSEFFHKIFKEHGKELFGEEKEVYTSGILYHLLTGKMDQIEEDIKQAAEDLMLEKREQTTTLSSIFDFLCWVSYFSILEENGVREVKGDFPREIGIDGTDGKYQVPVLKAYFEHRADILGKQMEEARKKFSYQKLKESYKECTGGINAVS